MNQTFLLECPEPRIKFWLHPSMLLPQTSLEFNDINEVPEALILPAQKGISVRCGSCHLDRALDVEIGVEY
jgi:hypothetical protein